MADFDRSLLRAWLSVVGFTSSRSPYRSVKIKHGNYIMVLAYPYWFIGVLTAEKTTNFISAAKARAHISKLLWQGMP